MQLSKVVGWIGMALIVLGAGTYASIFLIVLINGTWPSFLYPVQSRFRIASYFLGNFAFIAEVLLFVAPGLLLKMIAEWLEGRRM